MNQKRTPTFSTLFAFGVVLAVMAVLLVVVLVYEEIAVLYPKGAIALKERDLLVFTAILALSVGIPVFVLTPIFTWKYREENSKTKYAPDWGHHPVAEWIWWGLPCALIVVLASITWIKTHELDPYKPLGSAHKSLVIQVVALQWKWLFIYPEQRIATVNFIQIPEKTPIDFVITGEAPMNSLWIPALSGQIYAMAGMRTELHLIANEKGLFRGSSANLSGKGFAGMTFAVQATSQADFKAWARSVKRSPSALTMEGYNALAAPSENNPVALYTLEQQDLFDRILMKYMAPQRRGT